MKIITLNLPRELTVAELEEMFIAYGDVKSCNIVTDDETGKSKGFGFVEMSDQGAAEKAIEGLNGKELDGRAMKVNESKPREDRPRRPRY